MELTELMRAYDEHVYESQKHTRKLIDCKWEQTSTGDYVQSKFEPVPENDKIVDWLKENSLFRLTSAWQGHCHSDYTYVLMGSNNVMCAVNVKTKNFSGGELLNPRDHVYQHTVTIRAQPKEKELPSELTDILKELEFSKKDV